MTSSVPRIERQFVALYNFIEFFQSEHMNRQNDRRLGCGWP